MDDDDRSDPDRAAILARRQRFIALALSGLSVSCGKNGGSPTPCLDVGPAETSGADDGVTSGGSSSTGMPMPCLDVDPTLDGTVDETGTDTSGSDTSGSDSSGTDSSGPDDGTSSSG